MTLLKVANLKTYYFGAQKIVKAVDDISFNVKVGEIFGVCGESGSGKSTLFRSILRLPPATTVSGSILFEGDDLLKMSTNKFRNEILWKNISVIPQNSMDALNPMFKTGDQIVEKMLFHSQISKDEARASVMKMFETVGVEPSVADLYPFELSGGMNQRVLIVMSLVCNPKLVLADEPTSNVDVVIQDQILRMLTELQRRLDLTLILITHNIPVISQIADKTVIMYLGKITEIGDTSRVIHHPTHPYTQALIKSVIPLRQSGAFVESIRGVPASPANPPKGCRFHPRCSFALDECRREEPKFIEVEEGHFCACHLVS